MPTLSLVAMVRAVWALAPRHTRSGLLLHVPLGVLAAFVELACAAAVFGLVDGLVAAELGTASASSRLIGASVPLRELAAAAVVLFVVKAIVTTFASHQLAGVVEQLRADLMARSMLRALTSPWLVHLERGPTAVVNDVTHDAWVVADELVSALASAATSALVVVALLVPLALAAPLATLVAAFGVLAWVIVVHRLTKGATSALGDLERSSRRASLSVLAGALAALRELRAQGRVGDTFDVYRASLAGLAHARQRRRTIEMQPRLWSESLVVIVLALAVLSGAARHETFALLGAAAYAAMRVLPLANGAVWFVLRAHGGASSIIALRDLPERAALHEQVTPTAAVGADAALVDVTFAYAGQEPVFRALSFRAAPGERVGVVGPSGAGKSTLLGLIVGTHEPTEGAVLINGRPPRAGAARLAYVPQESALFAGTVRENITLTVRVGAQAGGGKPHEDERARAALAVAALDGDALPAGLDTAIGEAGAGLSGGQRQRVALARAVFHAPALLILDEATAALDRDTEAAVMDRLAAWARSAGDAGRCTVLVVTHRRDVAARCDRVIELDGGQLRTIA